MSLSLSVMRRFLAVAAFISASLFAVAPNALAQCRNGWCQAHCDEDGICNYVKVISRDYPYIIYMDNDPEGMFKRQVNCKQFKSRTLAIDGDPYVGEWRDAMPNSIGEAILETVCKM